MEEAWVAGSLLLFQIGEAGDGECSRPERYNKEIVWSQIVPD